MEGLGLGRAYVRLPGSNLPGAVVRSDGIAANNRASRLDACVTCFERHKQNIKGIEKSLWEVRSGLPRIIRWNLQTDAPFLATLSVRFRK
jgi:hypothetical protein